MASYRKPDVSRLTRAAHAAAIRERRDRPLSGVHATSVLRGLGEVQCYEGTCVEAGPISSWEEAKPISYGSQAVRNSWESSAGIQSSSGSSIGTGVTSFLSNLFSSGSSTTTPGYMPTTSNTSTYLLIGAAVVGGIVLITLLK